MDFNSKFGRLKERLGMLPFSESVCVSFDWKFSQGLRSQNTILSASSTFTGLVPCLSTTSPVTRLAAWGTQNLRVPRLALPMFAHREGKLNFQLTVA